jgi:predicted outer membrane repeat protein
MTVAGGYAGWQGGTTFDWTTRTSRATIIDLQGAASRAFRAQWLSGNGPSSGPTFEGLTFQNANVTNDGGAIHVAEQNYWTAYVTNCLFTNNTTTTGNGGAVRLGSAYVSGAIRSSDFIGNRAATNGGAVAFYVGQGTPMVEDCTFLRNTATVSRGGAIWWDGTGGPVQAVRRCRFEGNVAALSGGAAFSKDPYIQFDRCLFVSNTAPAGAAVGGADYWCGATRCRTALCMAIPAGMPCNRRVRESTTTPSTFSILPS